MAYFKIVHPALTRWTAK